MSIYDNVAFGIKLYEQLPRSEMEGRVEDALTRAALWGEVKTSSPSLAVAVRRPAAALVHRPHRGDAAGSDFAGRALFGASIRSRPPRSRN